MYCGYLYRRMKVYVPLQLLKTLYNITIRAHLLLNNWGLNKKAFCEITLICEFIQVNFNFTVYSYKSKLTHFAD